MNMPIGPEKVPLHTDADGVVRVGGTRVTLDTLVEAWAEGATPEEMVQQYPSLDLARVYAAIAWHLSHRPEVEQYLKGRREQAEQVQQEWEAHSSPVGVRDRLLARRRTGKAC
jgi:uncharacterized protein (DUF433 family)